MKIFVTGGTGFTGSRLVPLLLQNGYQVRCLSRPTSDRSLLLSALQQPRGVAPDDSNIEWVRGDLSDTQALSTAMQGMDSLVNIASLGFGHAASIIQAAQTAGVRRCVFISTTAIFTRLAARSKSIRLEAERAIRASGLQYTILRPTMIYGSRRDRNLWRLIRFLRFSPIIPIFGDGNSLQQPIYVDDVAQAILACLQSERTIGKCYNLAGKDPLTYNQIINTIGRQMNKRLRKVHLPFKPVAYLLRVLAKYGLRLPIKSEQVLRLNEDKNFEYAQAQQDFGFTPLSFEEGISRELRYLSRTGMTGGRIIS